MSEVRREFEWHQSLSSLSYSNVEVKLVLSAPEYLSQPDKERLADLTQAALFLREVAAELDHMATGVKSNE